MGMESRRARIFLLSIIALVSAVSEVSGSGDEGKVKLELYYESLCPYCARFIVDYIPKLFENGLIHITDIKFYPYGNGFVLSNGTIFCQHGKNECLLNTIEACAIDAWPELNEYFPFIYCVENLAYHGKHSEWKSCFDKLNLNEKPVVDCFESGRGNELELQYAAETDALEPPQKYVPWVVVNGQPLNEDYENFIDYICKAYRGTAPTPACSASFNVIQKGRKISPVCAVKTTSKLSTISSAIKSWINQVVLAASA